MKAFERVRVPPLVAVGLISEALYLALAVRLPWWRYGGELRSWSSLLGEGWGSLAACLIGIILLIAAYLWGWRLVRAGGLARRWVWGFAILFAATLFWLLPITADLFLYLSRAHLFTDLGGNPLLQAPLRFARDRLLLAYATSYLLHPTIYGPVWLLLSAPGTLGPYDVAGGVFYLKALVSLAYLGCGWLVERILRQLRPTAAVEGLYLFAWNPLVLLMAVGDGHNDIVMMAAVLLAVWLLLRQRWVPAFSILALSALVKYVSLALFPLFVLYAWQRLDAERSARRWPALVGSSLAAVAISALAFAPFWDHGLFSGLLLHFFQPINWRSASADLSMATLEVGLLLFAGTYLALVWWLGRGGGSSQRLADAAWAVLLLVFLLGAARSQPWHLIWAAALAGLSRWRWAWPVVIGLSLLMLVVQAWVEWGAPGLEII